MQQPVDFLQTLVATPSVSGHEEAATALMVEKARALGFSATADEAGNAVCERETAPVEGRSPLEIVLLGHIDTVPGEIEVRVEDGLLYGRGAVDAKGPLATFLYAAHKADLAAGTRLVVIGAVEEESATSRGARFAATRHQPDICIVGEPSGWDGLTLGYKGRLLVDYTLEQAMGHTAGPQLSVGEHAVNWWNLLQEYCRVANRGHAGMFQQIQPSIRSLTTSSDGMQDCVSMKVGLRLPPGFELHKFRRRARSWEQEGRLTFYGYEAAFTTSRRTPLVTLFNQVMRERGLQPTMKLKTGTADMNVVGPIWQCPIVAYGPGDSMLDHTPEEHIVLQEYLGAIDILAEVLSRLSRLR